MWRTDMRLYNFRWLTRWTLLISFLRRSKVDEENRFRKSYRYLHTIGRKWRIAEPFLNLSTLRYSSMNRVIKLIFISVQCTRAWPRDKAGYNLEDAAILFFVPLISRLNPFDCNAKLKTFGKKNQLETKYWLLEYHSIRKLLTCAMKSTIAFFGSILIQLLIGYVT